MPAGNYLIRLTNSKGFAHSYPFAVIPRADESKAQEARDGQTPVTTVNCAEATALHEYFDDGQCRVINSDLGSYRESYKEKWFSGFCYKVKIRNPGKAHWLEVNYPDDKARSFYVGIAPVINGVVRNAYVDAMGIITGIHHPITGTVQTQKLLFWPDTQEYMVVFGRWRNVMGEAGPAAVSFQVLEQNGTLPKLQIANPGGRQVAIWQEDPNMFASCWYNQNQLQDGIAMDFWQTKYDRLEEYMDYMGINAFSVLGCDYFGNLADNYREFPASSSYARNGYLHGYLDLLATRFERDGKKFYFLMNNRHFADTGYTLAYEKVAGRPSPRTVYEAVTVESNTLFAADNTIKNALNPIHPGTVEFLRQLIDGYLKRYGRYGSFAGIDFLQSCPLFFQNGLQTGYGDWMVGAFNHETSAGVPEFSGLERFSRRYDWMMEHCRESWIHWRCRKTTEVIKSLAGQLQDRKMIFRIPVRHLPQMSQILERGEAPVDIVNQPLKEMGIDVAALRDIPNLVLMPEIRPNYSRTGLTGNANGDERAFNFSDEFATLLQRLNVPAVSLSMHSCMEVYRNGLAEIAGVKQVPAPGFNLYAIVHPNPEYAAENAAFVLAKGDPQYLWNGWWGNPECGVYEKYRMIYGALRILPEEKFSFASGINDPITVRQQGPWVYCVNLAPFSSRVAISFDRNTVKDAISDEPCESGQLLSVEIPPYAVRVFKAEKELTGLAVKQVIPEQELQKIAALLEEKKMKAGTNQGALRILTAAQALFTAGCYAATYHALQHRLLLPDTVAPEKPSVCINPLTKSIRVKGRHSFTILELPDGWTKRTDTEFDTAEAFREETDYTVKLSMDGMERSYRSYFQYANSGKGETPYHIETPAASKATVKFAADYTYYWNANGIGIHVRADDQKYYQPAQPEHMYRDDSIQLYFDTENRSADDTTSVYPQGVSSFQAGLIDGKPVLYQDYPQKKIVTDAVISITAANGKIDYDIYIPKSYLPSIDFAKGSIFGFALQINNREEAKQHGTLSSRPSLPAPYLNPCTWNKVILN